MWVDNAKYIIEKLPEHHTEHNGAKIYKHWNNSLDVSDISPPDYFYNDKTIVENRWYCALCFAEGMDLYVIKKL